MRSKALRPAGVPVSLHHLLLWCGFAALFMMLALAFRRGALFEGPDELEHVRMARTIAQLGALPVPDAQPYGEYHQAPLAYLLLAPLVNNLDWDGIDAFDMPAAHNPYYGHLAILPGNDNKAIYLHTRTQNSSAVYGSLMILRLVGIGWGILTLAVCFRLFRELFGTSDARTWLALGYVAFLPQNIYTFSVVTNDNLLIFLTSCVVLVVVMAHRRGMTWQRATLLGALIGACALTKISGLAVGVGIAVFWIFHPGWWRWTPLVLGLAGAVFGWWAAQTWLLYQDPLLLQNAEKTWIALRVPADRRGVIFGMSQSIYAYFTYFARFGSGAVSVPMWIYYVWDAFFWMTPFGLLLVSRRRASPAHRMLAVGLIAMPVGWYAVLVFAANSSLASNQGRYMLPTVSVFGIFFASGMGAWMPRRWRRGLSIALISLLALMASVSVFGYFQPAYQTLPASATLRSPQVQYADLAQLTDMTLPAEAQRGEIIFVTLHWRSLRTPTQPLFVRLSSINAAGALEERVIARESYPGTGTFPSEDWLAGDVWAEQYAILIADDAPSGVYKIVVELVEASSGQPIGIISEPGTATLRIR